MTPIKDMQPGPEMDEIVALKVMGWVKDVDYWISPRNNVCQLMKGGIFDPSTDISAAWEVVEKFDTYQVTKMHNVASEKDKFRAIVQRNQYAAYAETAPHAICLAALMAVGGE